MTYNTPIWAVVDPGSGPVTRMAMFVNEWPTRWDRSAKESNVPIQCAGIMRRLQQGAVLKSPLYRAILGKNNPTPPVAFWPLEDGTDATQGASGLASGSPIAVRSGSISFGADTSISGVARGPTVTNGVLSAPLTGFGSTGFSFEFSSLAIGDAGGTLGAQVTVYLQGGTLERVMVKPPYDTSLNQAVLLNSKSPGLFATLASTLPNIPNPTVAHHYRVELQQSGSDITGTFYVDGVGYPASALGVTLGTPYAVAVNAPYSTITLADDHITGSVVALAVYNATTITDHSGAVSGYAGELATTRIRRLAVEENVPMVCTSGLSPAMGAQTEDTFINLLRECEAVDMGVLYETNWGLGYQSTNDRTDQPVALALSKTSRHLAVEPEPADDDQRLRNKWTVSRTNGGSATAQLTTGNLGTSSVGTYDDSATLNVYLDSQLADEAGWKLHLGTVDEDRWPSLSLRFHGTPTLIPSWVALPYGSRITLSSPPSQMAPDTVNAILEGWTERWDTRSWVAELATSPYAPYRVGTLANDTGDTAETLLILTPDTLTLATAVDTTATSWSVNSSPVWTTNSEMFPRRIMWEGEELSLTACSGASAPQTWTVTRSVNGVVKSHAAGTTGRIIYPGVLGLA